AALLAGHRKRWSVAGATRSDPSPATSVSCTRRGIARAWRLGTFATALVCTCMYAAQAGHEVSYYPSFYPQQIRVEPLDPAAAGRELGNPRDPLHAYLGATPRFTADVPAHLKSVVSLRSLITVRINPASQALKDRDARCRALAAAASMLAKAPDVVAHAYPITPYHADYLGHIDKVPNHASGPAQDARSPPPRVRA